MKKIAAIITVVLLLLMCAPLCLAAEYAAGDSAEIKVEADYMYDKNMYSAELSDGKYTVVTDDGITVTATPKDGAGAGLIMIVRVITAEEDAEAYSWITQCLADIGDKLVPYDIYFIDADGNKVDPVGGVRVELPLPGGYTTPIVCGLSSSGTASVLSAEAVGAVIAFDTDSSGYFTLAEKAPEKIPETTQGATDEKTDETTAADAPPTGDNGVQLLIFTLAALVCTAACACILARKHRGHGSAQ